MQAELWCNIYKSVCDKCVSFWYVVKVWNVPRLHLVAESLVGSCQAAGSLIILILYSCQQKLDNANVSYLGSLLSHLYNTKVMEKVEHSITSNHLLATNQCLCQVTSLQHEGLFFGRVQSNGIVKGKCVGNFSL